MARSKKTPGPGHNIALTEDEIATLETYYAHKIKAQQKKAEAAKVAYDAERGEVNTLFAKVKGDLKTSRKDFEDLLAKQAMTPAEFANHWAKLAARYARNGLPVGAQQELFPSTGDTADDQVMAHAAGVLAGRNGEDPDAPGHILSQDWLAGWHEGQKELFLQLEKADGIFAKLAQAKGELTEGEDDSGGEAEDEAEIDASPEAVDQGARKLRKSGWTEPTREEAAFEPTH